MLPARSALVGVPLWQHALAVVLVVASIYALVRFAGRVYAQGLLHSGPRLDSACRLAAQPPAVTGRERTQSVARSSPRAGCGASASKSPVW